MNEANTFENLAIEWRPTDEIIEKAQLTKFMKQVGVSTWDELYQKSIEDVESFTDEVLKFLDIKFNPPYEKLLDTSEGIEWSKWCVGGGLNITEMCLDRWQDTEIENQPAIIWEGEAGEVEEISYKELLEQVELCAAGLRANDLGKGDAVGIHLPMMIETVIALLAINRIGAIAVPVFSGYGVEAISSRMNAVKAKAIFICDGFYRRGRKINVVETDLEAIKDCPTIEKVFFVGSANKESFLKNRKEIPAFVYAMERLYPEIKAEEILNYFLGINLFGSSGKNHKSVEIDNSIKPEDFSNSTPNYDSKNFEQIDKIFERISDNSQISAKEFKQIFSDKSASKDLPSISYIEVVGDLKNNGYEIDLSVIETEMLRMPSEISDAIARGESIGFGSGAVFFFGKYATPENIFTHYNFETISFNLLMQDFEEIPKTSLEATSANDPAIILYSSGTTGRPKGIAHVHCGFPIKAAQDMAFGTDVGRGTRISWVTDIGWMMGPWLIYGALINGATMCLYDGSPDYPKPDRMWEFSAKHKVEILGISPTLIRVLSTKGDELPKKHDLSNLRAFASTGEPWNPAPWYWLFEKVGGGKLPIINYSGGTEISGGILMGNPLLPQKPGSFPAPCPGMAADILNETGESAEVGEVGELAIRKPWIGMARGFWEENERYLETYWSRFEKIWVHGDFAVRDADDQWYILGRSDDTLNVAGKRVGPAEIESLLVADSRVVEAAVIGVPDKIKGTAMVAICVLKDDETENLETELKNLVAKDMGKPLTPKRIHFVSALSKTRNGKVMRRVIRSAYLGEDVGDVSALENPQTVEEMRNVSKR